MPDPLISLIVAAIITTIVLVFFWPNRGIFWRLQQANLMTDRVLREDALKQIFHFENQGKKPSIESLAMDLGTSTDKAEDVVNSLESLELVNKDLNLTSTGRDYALRIIRAHRLYERYLSEETGFDATDWHVKAHDIEHRLSPDEIEQLATRLGNPTHDPHGDPIPTSDGNVIYSDKRIILNDLPLNTRAQITHLEDEPVNIYAQLVAEGLHIGQELQLIEKNTQRVRFWADDDEHILAPVFAANISVIPISEKKEEIPGEPLSLLKQGDQARVVRLSPEIRGAERRRLMDLGFLPGTLIENELVSSGGDPIAYRIRGAVIALRKSQAELISVSRDNLES